MDTPGGKSEMRGTRDERDMAEGRKECLRGGGNVSLLSFCLSFGTLSGADDRECERLPVRVVSLAAAGFGR